MPICPVYYTPNCNHYLPCVVHTTGYRWPCVLHTAKYNGGNNVSCVVSTERYNGGVVPCVVHNAGYDVMYSINFLWVPIVFLFSPKCSLFM